MDEVIELSKKLKSEIDNLPEMKEYLKLKKLIENDDELAKMRLDIARLANEKKYEERDNLLQIYNSHPLVNNFYLAEEEIKSLLQSIKNIIE